MLQTRRFFAQLLDKFGRPLKPSFFTGRESFYECYNFLDQVLKTSKITVLGSPNLPISAIAANTKGRQWKLQGGMEHELGFKLRPDEYERLVDKLNQIVHFQERIPALQDLLNVFTDDSMLKELERKLSYQVEIDSNGISYAEGRRRTAQAQVWLKPSSDGVFLVNDQLAHEHFGKQGDIRFRAELWRPFEATNTFSQFNVYALVTGGGPAGQAEAIRHALSNALVKQNLQFLEPLEKQNLLKIDYRRKERKKYGRHRARRSFQWSKR